MIGLSASLTPVPPFLGGHKHYMMPDGKDVFLATGSAWYHQCALDTDGIVYPCTWLYMETGLDTYRFTRLVTALDYAHAQGKKLIVRIFYKSYSAVDPKPLPDYILNDHATYGGDLGAGGLLPNQFSGYMPRMHNAALMTRFLALVTAMAAAIKDHPALEAVCIDEGTWSLTTASGTWPVTGLTTQDLIDVFAEINAHFKASFSDTDVYVFVNFFEGASAATTRSVLLDYIANGYLPAITDTKRKPENNTSLQDVDPLYPMNHKTLMCVDYMSTGADDTGLQERMIQNAMENSRCRANITAWYTRGGASSNYWAAAVNAMNVCR